MKKSKFFKSQKYINMTIKKIDKDYAKQCQKNNEHGSISSIKKFSGKAYRRRQKTKCLSKISRAKERYYVYDTNYKSFIWIDINKLLLMEASSI